jgi:osmotically-inducible protein OsmY
VPRHRDFEYLESRDFDEFNAERRSDRSGTRNYRPDEEELRRYNAEQESRRRWDGGERAREEYGREFDRGGLLGRRGYRYRENDADTPFFYGRTAESWAPSGYDNNFGAMDRWDQFRTERESGRLAPVHYGKGPRGYQRSDERIKEDVNEILYENPYIDASNIEVQVENGVVTLTGAVENGQLRRLSEECIECIPGVKDVDNRLRATPEAFAR